MKFEITPTKDGWYRLVANHNGIIITAEYRSWTEAAIHLVKLSFA